MKNVTPDTEVVDELVPTTPDGRPFRILSVTVSDSPVGPTDPVSFEGAVTSVGSHRRNDLVVDDPALSRCHFELRRTPEGFRLVDTESRNGTELDGVRVQDAYIRHGSVVRAGRSTFSLALVGTDEQPEVTTRVHFGRLHGRSLAMRETFTVLERASKSEATILIRGETGTGKEEAARAIHEESARAEGPFVVVDCSALPPTLLESELFGHEKGAFTGAERQRAGAMELADGGTIFLDEIGELPLDLQPKLLRFLEERSVRRVGGSSRQQVDVRVVAATHRGLRGMVNEGRFRADLFYRLSVIRAELPALRERPEDLEDIVRALLKRLPATDAQREEVLSKRFLREVAFHAWPGNVRELRNHLERYLILGDAYDVWERPSLSDPPAATEVDIGKEFSDARKDALDRFERAYLEKLMRENNGAVLEAAKQAGIHRVYLYKLLKRHRLR